MPRDHQTATGAVWYEKVDTKQMRLRVAEDFWFYCSWTKGASKTVDCVALPAANGQLQLFPSTARDYFYETLGSSMRSSAASLSEDPLIVDFSRFYAVGRSIKITHEPEYSRCSIALSADLVAVGFGPSRGEDAVVFALGEIVEIWSLVQWRKLLREIAPKLNDLQQKVIESIKERSV